MSIDDFIKWAALSGVIVHMLFGLYRILFVYALKKDVFERKQYKRLEGVLLNMAILLVMFASIRELADWFRLLSVIVYDLSVLLFLVLSATNYRIASKIEQKEQ